jgi:hypothetical protein
MPNAREPLLKPPITDRSSTIMSSITTSDELHIGPHPLNRGRAEIGFSIYCPANTASHPH